MSYSGFGFFDKDCSVTFGKPAAECTGGVQASNCSEVCCGLNTLSNETFRTRAGAHPWKHWNERRIRIALNNLLAKPAGEKMSLIRKMAMDAGAAGASLFEIGKITKAASNFNVLYPWKRWDRTGTFEEDLTLPYPHTCRWTYKDTSPIQKTDAYWTALADVGATKETEEGWRAGADAVINSVPGSGSTLRVSDPVTAVEPLVTFAGGKLVMSAWLQSFVNKFQGKLQIRMKPGTTTAQVPDAPADLATGTELTTAAASSASDKPKRPMTAGTTAAIGLGALALAAGAYYWSTRRSA